MPAADLKVHRIYQGRALRVWSKSGNDWFRVEDGAALLWAHHELFQSAVNYYLLALAAMATDPQSPIGRMRTQMADCWNDFRRVGESRRGMRRSLAPFIGDWPSIGDAMEHVMRPCAAAAEVRQLALDLLAGKCQGDSAIQQSGRGYWPRFCDPAWSGTWDFVATSVKSAERGLELATALHAEPVDWPSLLKLAAQMELDWAGIKVFEGEGLVGEDAIRRISESIEHWLHKLHAAADERERQVASLKLKLNRLPAERLRVQRNRKADLDRVHAAILFQVFPDETTRSLLAEKISAPKATKRSARGRSDGDDPVRSACLALGDDPIRVCRGERGVVFDAFTALPAWSGSETASPCWKEFDIAAFKEALKTINQIASKQAERDALRRKYERVLAWIRDGEGEPGAVFRDTEWEDSDELPGTLAADPRAERLRALLEDELAVANELTGGEAAAYAIRTRTLRGHSELFERWNTLLDKHEGAGETELIAACDEHQEKHRDDMGSATLFRKLASPELWMIWRRASPEQAKEREDHRWSDDLLRDYALGLEVAERIEELRLPIRFTPADPDSSRRLYMASDIKGRFTTTHVKHEGAHAIEMGLASLVDGRWTPWGHRVVYSAPRLQRDGIHGDPARWLPPMLRALLPESAESTGIGEAAVQLMPDRREGRLRVLINFPVELDVEAVQRTIGVASRWGMRQFNSRDGTNLHLFWPETDALRTGKTHADWWMTAEPWSVLSVDLGQRFAAACARFKVTAEDAPVCDKGWHLGAAGNHQWNARLEKSCVLRLPGEGCKVWDGKQWRQEIHGERGRPASTLDTREAEAMLAECVVHGLDPRELQQRTFPEQNDLLLVAIRRLQGWFSRLHRWRWMLGEPSRAPKAREELSSQADALVRLHVPGQAGLGEILIAIDRELAWWQEKLPRLLLQLTSRILPLRARRWEWVPNPERDGSHLLRQAAGAGVRAHPKIRQQRGLSLRRIEQIEELRKRWQSLNRTLMRKPGERPPSGRELRNDPVPDPCPELLRKLEQVKRQRVDQTAHMIVAEALGVALTEPHAPVRLRVREDRHGEYRCRREPVAFIVIEDLARYLSSQDRAPSENSRLMKWCHRAIATKLRMLCEPLGIRVLEVGASYSSRFCSRTAVAGFRAVEVTLSDRDDFVWRKRLERFDKAKEAGQTPEREDEVVHSTFALLERLETGRSGKPLRTLILPRAGGPLFVPMRDWPETTRKTGVTMAPPGVQQADINAAINIGLRAMAGPGADRVHVRIRMTRHEGGWRTRDASNGNMIERARWKTPAEVTDIGTGTGGHLTAFWDHGWVSEFETSNVGAGTVASGKGLWTAVKRGQWARAQEINGRRLLAWEQERMPY